MEPMNDEQPTTMAEIFIPPSEHFYQARRLLAAMRANRQAPFSWVINPTIWKEMERFFKEYLHSYAISEGTRTLLYGIPVILSDDEESISLI